MTGLVVGLTLVVVGIALILWLPVLWVQWSLRRHPEGVSQQWLNEHEYDKDGDGH